MKKLSDYTGSEAIELWADMLEPLTAIMSDKEIADTFRQKKHKIIIAKTILKNHSKEAEQILLRIDPDPLNGVTVITRIVMLLAEIGQNEEIKSFFGYAEQGKMDSEYSGSVMENTEESGI